MEPATLLRVSAAAVVVAVSVPGHALAASAIDDCARLLPKGWNLPAVPGEAAVEPVRGSALFTSPRLAVNELRTRGREQGKGTRFLAFSEKGGAAVVFAELRTTGTSRTDLAWGLPHDGGLEEALRRLAVFEHLYSFVLHEPPLHLYDVRAIGSSGAKAQALSQPELLVRFARMRNCAAKEVARTGGSVAVLAWETPSLGKPVARGAGRLDVSVRVTYPNAGGHGGSITIARGSHLACSAQVERDGVAACTLFDSHGHAEHGDELSGPSVVTYSGVVERTRIVLPITRVDIDNARLIGRRPTASRR
jgi:hypothetical protein